MAEDARSLTRQIARATQYAGPKGWVVPAEYIFSDDGVSGAEFENDWRGLLTMHVAQARQILRKLIDGRLRFRPEGRGFVF